MSFSVEISKNICGAKIIDADKIAKSLSNDLTSDYFKEMVELFGKELLQENGMLNRRKIATIIYSDKDKRNKLNELNLKALIETKRGQGYILK